VKHRSLAVELVEGGHVRVNSIRITKTSHTIKPQDVLTIALYNEVKVVKVLGEAEKRGPAPAAQQLYEHLNSEKMDAQSNSLSYVSPHLTNDGQP
jgi:ribosome-associated heat shock protein Hsp15